MTILNEIARTIHAIRRAADCDVERLCFEVTDAEWTELLDWLYSHGWTHDHRGDVVSTQEHLVILGIRVRKRPPSPGDKP